MYIYSAVSNGKQKTDPRKRKRKNVVYPFVDEGTNRIYPFANGLNRLAHL